VKLRELLRKAESPPAFNKIALIEGARIALEVALAAAKERWPDQCVTTIAGLLSELDPADTQGGR
jgi:hypothetical protein